MISKGDDGLDYDELSAPVSSHGILELEKARILCRETQSALRNCSNGKKSLKKELFLKFESALNEYSRLRYENGL